VLEADAGAGVTRSKADVGDSAGGPSLDPRTSSSVHAGTNASAAFPEIDCLRRLLAADLLAAAELRAAAIGVGADRVLIAGGAIEEETYLRILGHDLGVAYEPLDLAVRANCPVDDERLIESGAAGLLPMEIGGELSLVIAPRAVAARRLAIMLRNNPGLAHRFRFTSTERLNRFVLQNAGRTLCAQASNALQRLWPALSAAPPRRFDNLVPIVLLGVSLSVALVFASDAVRYFFETSLAALFLAWLGLRLVGAFIDSVWRNRARALSDRELPVYTIIAALYGEASSVDGLLAAIERLDYPSEKLDVILAVEADDEATRGAIAARKSRLPIVVIPIPVSHPRTKPKALNVALPFARGAFSVVYDAEDQPEADQLRNALRAFRAGGKRLACVQARLCIDNTADSWLARLFTAEYAGQFDVFLPGIAALALPLPLGGSSNHFRTASLREVGGWDAYNVTEDADLGMRLARFGYRAGVIASSTYEEAPARLVPWLRQRTRWFKGWMQTWLVHMREPRRLWQNLGPWGFFSFQLIVGGNVLAALVHPLFLGSLIYALASGAPPWHGNGTVTAMLAALYGTIIVIGYLSSALLGWLGLMRRGLLANAWVLFLTPLHWLLLSLAAWRGLYQLVFSPYAWEKTEHGLAMHSRLAAMTARRRAGPGGG
jgi:cellulose synthase/poly-beta-1,6-N-acetylglucosamine synthase-like glycosyltransferase